ncbi:MAG: 16S rRNA (cytidine(1402)-2'-O)-methyltransferase [Verrucomicrobia bacterium]|nr:16S rRNA (cytidine(1402)-2'-O)-methyltransferase [Verrucomicrobiota bacterium]
MQPGLYIVGTPIGNLGDMTFRGVETLRDADLILAEDTRHTRILLNHFEIRTHCESCHKFNEASRLDSIVERISAGQAIALVSDSGMPCVSDPGSRVVEACQNAGCYVTVVPGPSSVTTALSVSGFGGAEFTFAGFLAVKPGARGKKLAAMLELPHPVVFFESPHRFLKLLAQLEETAPERTIVVGRELTKKFEEIVRGTPVEIAAKFEGRAIKGEFVVVIGPA